MKIKTYIYILSIFGAVFLLASSIKDFTSPKEVVDNKINGVNFVAPMNEIGIQNLTSLNRINANWIAVIPYAYTPKDESAVYFYHEHPHWWGEGVEGAMATIVMAKKLGIKVMLKPQVWVIGDGWPGEFEATSEEDWKKWEIDYSNYILTYAKLCDSLEVDLLCIGTEYRQAVIKRSAFWTHLIKEVRKYYSGKLTYAANWDNYENVDFWNEVDFIGIDAYFPLSPDKTPSVHDLMQSWSEQSEQLEDFCNTYKMKAIFTEYGYQSCDYSAYKQWENKGNNEVNLLAQQNAYEALYRSIWNQEWMLGGFLWKWHAHDDKAGGSENDRFTPQNKPAEKIIQQYYSN